MKYKNILICNNICRENSSRLSVVRGLLGVIGRIDIYALFVIIIIIIIIIIINIIIKDSFFIMIGINNIYYFYYYYLEFYIVPH